MKYSKFERLMKKIADVNYATAVLMWDQETYMPVKGDALRSQQIATLSGISHELTISNELSDLLNELNNDTTLTENQKINVRETKIALDKKKKFDTEFVMNMSKTISNTFIAWQKAKSENKIELYLPHLEKIIVLKQEEAKILGYKEHIYDALIDQYEPDMTVAVLDKLFIDVKNQLKPLLDNINAQTQVSDACLSQHFDKDAQWKMGLEILKRMGYDFEKGRQDISSHPFTTSFSAEDVRVTTRLDENDLANMVWSCIHEGGHALYEQGLPIAEYAMPLGEAISLGIHESQSRLWENNVGRGFAFWKHNYQLVQDTFPTQFSNVPLEDFYKAMNKVRSSFIRTESDELTYHFHIMIRYEIEKKLIEGSLSTTDLKETWNSMYKEYLGVDIIDDRKGVLQDVHWSHGSFGYFPTYSLGSFYAAQFFDQAKKDIPNLITQIENGDNSNLLQWLRTNIHQYGRKYKANELCKKITGNELELSHFMNYATDKYKAIYGF
jgi:carboxypeptidase Taq